MSGYPLRCENLCKKFGGVVALDQVSINFSGNCITAIVGPNGAGKSTLLDVLSGMCQPDAGRSYMAEQEITGLAAYKVANLGLIRSFQELRLIKNMSLLENLLLASRHQKGERFFYAFLRWLWLQQEKDHTGQALLWLDKLGITRQCAAMLAGELSYGQQKLLSLACCLVNEGPIVFLDEPFAGVHPEIKMTLLDLMRTLKKTGRLVIFIEHDLDVVRTVADEVIVMDSGRVIAKGNPTAVLKQPDVLEAYVN